MRVKITGVGGWWDGVTSGNCDVEGKHCFFTLLSGEYTRTFCVYEYSPEEYKQSLERSADFIKYVYGGSYTERIDEDGKLQDTSGNVVSHDTFNIFYDKWKNNSRISDFPKREDSFIGVFRLKT